MQVVRAQEQRWVSQAELAGATGRGVGVEHQDELSAGSEEKQESPVTDGIS